MSRLRLVPAVAALVLVAACGDEVGDGQPRPGPGTGSKTLAPVAKPMAVPAAPGEVTTQYAVTVLDDGDGAELCLGGVADSLPPQCGGPKLVGWTWADHEGDFESRNGVRWGDFWVTGTFDGTAVTPTEVLAEREKAQPEDPGLPVQFATPCTEPDGGWHVLDPSLTTMETQDLTFQKAAELPGYATAWVDQSINPAWQQWQAGELPDRELETALNDPALSIINVKVTGDPAVAEATLRHTWGGSLCVTQAEHTQAELQAIADEVYDLPGSLGGGADDDAVELQVVYDDGSYQSYADATYGVGVVIVSSALVDAG